jgi:hypothetical protein
VALADLSDFVAKATGGNSGAPEPMWWTKEIRVPGAQATATVAGRWTSLWLYEGSPSGPGALPPTTATAPTRATDGALKQTNAAGALTKYLTFAGVVASAGGTLLIYDRLLHVSGLSAQSTATQTVGGTLTRYTGAASRGNFAWIEVNSTIGTSVSSTITANYTDDAGNAATSPAVQIGGTGLREAQRLIPLPLAAGDVGVRAVASVAINIATGTAGDIGVVVAHPLLCVPFREVGIMTAMSLLQQVAEVKPDACLAMAWLANTVVTPQIMASLMFVDA